MARTNDRALVLGWKITNKEQHPDYWMTLNPKLGDQTTDQLVTVTEASIRTNTIIVASQGSGKSFFLGRLIEEILLHTDGRILCFDPNSDFVRIHSTVRGTLWTKATYNPKKKSAQPLPHEKYKRTFKGRWDRIQKRVYSASKLPPPNSVRIALDWLDYRVEWLSDETTLAAENELRSCHDFVGQIRQLVEKSKTIKWRADHELLEVARDLWVATKDPDRRAVIAKLEEAFAFDADESSYQTRQCPLPPGKTVADFDRLTAPHIRAAAKHRGFMPDDAQRAYFNIGQAAKRSGVFATRYPLQNQPGTTAHFVDLLSIRNIRFKLMTALKYLEDEIEDAEDLHEQVQATQGNKGFKDPRKPLYIIVDEAHTLMPANPEGRLARDVLDRFRWIAGEGRKFGIYLIVVSQEPAKLDPRIVSLCKNRALMQMTGGAFLEDAIKQLGLSKGEASEARKAASFKQGRVLLLGRWASNRFRFLYGAMRRTFPGGDDIP
jgi:hypothetical protein